MKPKSIKFVAMTIHDAQRRLQFELYHQFDNAEAANIADLLMEKLTGWKRIDRIINRDVKLSAAMKKELDNYIAQVAEQKPVQYILNEAWFYGLRFYVDQRVLIPRPETEELVEWILSERPRPNAQILDVGTGSGCIAITLKKHIPSAFITACDVSSDALDVTRMNALSNEADVRLLQIDITDEKSWTSLNTYDIIVSNPPYIPRAEGNSMLPHVVNHEPHLALFVTDEDVLRNYRKIAELGTQKLFDGGTVFVEVHEDLASGVAEVFEAKGYKEVMIRKDMQGKQRMIRAILLNPRLVDH